MLIQSIIPNVTTIISTINQMQIVSIVLDTINNLVTFNVIYGEFDKNNIFIQHDSESITSTNDEYITYMGTITNNTLSLGNNLINITLEYLKGKTKYQIEA